MDIQNIDNLDDLEDTPIEPILEPFTSSRLRIPQPGPKHRCSSRYGGQNTPSDIHLTFGQAGDCTDRGQQVEVWLGDSLLCTSYDPEYAACRALEAKGISGLAHFWRKGKPNWDIRMGTKWGARHQTVERSKGGLSTEKYKEKKNEGK